jgi:hypothetical protein
LVDSASPESLGDKDAAEGQRVTTCRPPDGVVCSLMGHRCWTPGVGSRSVAE